MYDISRFLNAQEHTHAQALRELRNGRKQTHWSWWEIPQIIGLGMTSVSRTYAIKDINEAKEYLGDDTLRRHLTELCHALLSLPSDDAREIMGYPDDLKLRSCMTLFLEADPDCEMFRKVLDKFFDGEPDQNTLRILKEQE